MSADLAPPLLEAILAQAAITGRLGTYEGSASVHTRRPPPESATYPMIIISPDVSYSNEDGINDERPVIIRDLITYGEAEKHYRVVDEVSYLLRDMFHKKKRSITVPGYSVVDIIVTGPVSAPAENMTGRLVSVQTRLAALIP